jgi:hypothetical protein
MLLEFRVTNYRSVCEEQILSLRPESKHKDVPTNLLVREKKYTALNCLALYGPNDSGKSNLLSAINLLDTLVSNSSKGASTDLLPYDPFMLRQGWEEKPTEFEITFISNGNRYRYGVAYTAVEVTHEWLYRKGVGREVPLFEREGDTIEAKSTLGALPATLAAAIESTRPNSLFLSWCDTYNIAEVKHIRQWFYRLRSVDGLDTRFEGISTAEMLRDSALAAPISAYLTSLGLQVLGVEVELVAFNDTELPAQMPQTMRQQLTKQLKGTTKSVVKARHRLYDAKGKPTKNSRSWEWSDRESAGARKALEISGPVIWVLAQGGVLVIDEIEASLHTQLTQNTINLFLNPDTNPNRAQLLFATHDTNLLTYLKLRRDQIYFAEKNSWEGTETYALSDFRYLPLTGADGSKATTVRPDADKEKRYLEGRYGAIPANADFQRFVAQHTQWPTLAR